ncbi:hypothetical protein BC827DRAFT_318865 [Russula dissimulans]|nr:hypothetical protein BC827DRAFT_318865 [Russula dissimulans]
MRTGISLPKTDSLQVQQMANEDPNYLTVYNLCLRCENQFAADENKLCCIRLLGYLLLNAPNQSIRSELTRCIQSCQDDNNLSDLGSFCRLYFVFPCGFSGCRSCLRMPIYPPSFSVRRFKGRTPRSSRSSKPSFDAVKSQIKLTFTRLPGSMKMPKFASVDDRHFSSSLSLTGRTGSHARQLEMCCYRRP